MNRRLQAFLFLLVPLLMAAEKAEHPSSTADRKALLDKWIVRHVEQDGALIPAQVGQQVGDVITFKEGPAGGIGLS